MSTFVSCLASIFGWWTGVQALHKSPSRMARSWAALQSTHSLRSQTPGKHSLPASWLPKRLMRWVNTSPCPWAPSALGRSHHELFLDLCFLQHDSQSHGTNQPAVKGSHHTIPVGPRRWGRKFPSCKSWGSLIQCPRGKKKSPSTNLSYSFIALKPLQRKGSGPSTALLLSVKDQWASLVARDRLVP